MTPEEKLIKMVIDAQIDLQKKQEENFKMFKRYCYLIIGLMTILFFILIRVC